MVRELLICLVVVILIIMLNWYIQNYTKNSVSYIIGDLKELKENINQEKVQDINNKMDDIKQDWHEKFNVLAIFIEHDELEKVETNLSALEGFIEIQDYKTGINELNKSIFVLEHIADKYDFSLVNVF